MEQVREEKEEQRHQTSILAATSCNDVGGATMDVDDGEGTKGHPGSPGQLPAHQLHDVGDLVVALLHIVLPWRAEKDQRRSDLGHTPR